MNSWYIGISFLHSGERFQRSRVAGRADKSLLVQQIVLPHQSGLRIQIRAFRGHQFQIVVGCQYAVLDLGAAGQSSRAHSIFVSVHQRAQALLLRFIAGRVKLLL